MERKRNVQPEQQRRQAAAAIRTAAAAIAALPHEVERRNRDRIRHEAQPARNAEPVRLVDLSTHGCCLGFAAAADYRPGQFIRLGFPGESETVRAIVRWTEGMRVGAEFTNGLPCRRIEAILGEGRNPVVGLL